MTGLPIPTAIRPEQALRAFEAAARRRSSPLCHIAQDVLNLRRVADLLAGVARDITAHVSSLDTARRVADSKGAALRLNAFTPSGVDEYALVEALFWDRLSNEAETLLKVLLRQALDEVQP